jgi:hypothetical protein
MPPPSKRGSNPRRTDLLAVVRPGSTAGFASHGFARNQQWTLKAHNEDHNGGADL